MKKNWQRFPPHWQWHKCEGGGEHLVYIVYNVVHNIKRLSKSNEYMLLAKQQIENSFKLSTHSDGVKLSYGDLVCRIQL